LGSSPSPVSPPSTFWLGHASFAEHDGPFFFPGRFYFFCVGNYPIVIFRFYGRPCRVSLQIRWPDPSSAHFFTCQERRVVFLLIFHSSKEHAPLTFCLSHPVFRTNLLAPAYRFSPPKPPHGSFFPALIPPVSCLP